MTLRGRSGIRTHGPRPRARACVWIHGPCIRAHTRRGGTNCLRVPALSGIGSDGLRDIARSDIRSNRICVGSNSYVRTGTADDGPNMPCIRERSRFGTHPDVWSHSRIWAHASHARSAPLGKTYAAQQGQQQATKNHLFHIHVLR